MGLTGMDDLMEDILQQEADARVGTTLRDKWHLDSLLGVGGMAAVYAATHRNGMRGAVKLLHTTQARDATIKSRFLREGYIANKVDHVGAVRVLDDDVTETGSVFLVMELLEGMTLKVRAIRAGGKLTPDEVMLAAEQLLATLSVAHEKGIVHRDLKPENLFLTKVGVLKILDYGIAGLLEKVAGESAKSATRTGHPMGTPAFMSPEQARGRWELVDARSDLWSVGATMFALLSGKNVHSEGTASEIIAATFMKPARPLAEVGKHVPAPLAAIVDRALLLERDGRWQSAREMRQALVDAYESIHGEPFPAPPSSVQPRVSSANLLSGDEVPSVPDVIAPGDGVPFLPQRDYLLATPGGQLRPVPLPPQRSDGTIGAVATMSGASAVKTPMRARAVLAMAVALFACALFIYLAARGSRSSAAAAPASPPSQVAPSVEAPSGPVSVTTPAAAPPDSAADAPHPPAATHKIVPATPPLTRPPATPHVAPPPTLVPSAKGSNPFDRRN